MVCEHSLLFEWSPGILGYFSTLIFSRCGYTNGIKIIIKQSCINKTELLWLYSLKDYSWVDFENSRKIQPIIKILYLKHGEASECTDKVSNDPKCLKQFLNILNFRDLIAPIFSSPSNLHNFISSCTVHVSSSSQLKLHFRLIMCHQFVFSSVFVSRSPDSRVET